jgi:hypothetical protein
VHFLSFHAAITAFNHLPMLHCALSIYYLQVAFMGLDGIVKELGSPAEVLERPRHAETAVYIAQSRGLTREGDPSKYLREEMATVQ